MVVKVLLFGVFLSLSEIWERRKHRCAIEHELSTREAILIAIKKATEELKLESTKLKEMLQEMGVEVG
jgi:hypothetical protein